VIQGYLNLRLARFEEWRLKPTIPASSASNWPPESFLFGVGAGDPAMICSVLIHLWE
jgi:hypothetical protein